MNIFEIIKKGNCEELQQYVEQNPDALSENFILFEGPCSTVFSPIEYTVLTNQPSQFGVLYRVMKNKKIQLDVSTINLIIKIHHWSGFEPRSEEVMAFTYRFLAEICPEDKIASLKDDIARDYDSCIALLLENMVIDLSENPKFSIPIIKKLISLRFKICSSPSEHYPISLLQRLLRPGLTHYTFNTVPYAKTSKERIEIIQHLFTTYSKHMNDIINQKRPADLNYIMPWTYLIEVAVRFADLETIQFFINCGANLKIFDEAGTPLILSQLVDRVNQDTPDKENKEKFEIELHAIAEFVFKHLFEQININYTNKAGETALHFAVRHRNIMFMKILLTLKPELSLVSLDGFTALDLTQFLMDAMIYFQQEEISTPMNRQNFSAEEKTLAEMAELLKAAGAKEYIIPQVFMQAAQGFLKTLPNLKSVRTFEEEAYDFKKYAELVDAAPTASDATPTASDAAPTASPKVAITQPSQILMNHKRLAWDFSLQRSRVTLKKLGSNPEKRIDFDFGNGLVLKLHDYSNIDNYQFLVHTTSGNTDNLRAILNQDSDFFIKKTSFFSCSFIDKDTMLPIMKHQAHTIFPFGLILGVDADAILKAFPCDIDSPYGKISEEARQDYVAKIKKINNEYNAIESRAQDILLEQQKGSPNTLHSLKVFEKTKQFLLTESDNPGKKFPALSPKQCLQLTNHGYYNEIIVLGKANNTVLGIVLEKEWLLPFIGFSSNISNAHKTLFETLELFVTTLNKNPQIPVIMIDTAKNGHIHKQPLSKQFEHFKNQYMSSVKQFSDHLLRQHRNKQLFSKDKGKYSLKECGNALTEAQNELVYIRDLLNQKKYHVRM